MKRIWYHSAIKVICLNDTDNSFQQKKDVCSNGENDFKEHSDDKSLDKKKQL